MKAPRFTDADKAWLRANYGPLGPRRCAEHLKRSRQSVYVLANRMGLHSMGETRARQPSLQGDDLEAAIVLREEQGWSFARIGDHFDISETAASNAILIALCPRKGYRPATRDAHGFLIPEEIERLRLMLRKGLKAVNIQLRMGVSAACVAEQRRRYRTDLKARDKAPLPPPGNGERYSGVRVAKPDRKAVEDLFLEGIGGPRASKITGVSKSVCTRIRAALVKRLARKGQCLPGCDIDGVRQVQKAGLRNVHPAQVERLAQLLGEGMPVRQAANLVGIGHCSAYAIRDRIDAERAAQGQPPLPRIWSNSRAARAEAKKSKWLEGPGDIVWLRALITEYGYDAGVEAMRREIAARKAEQAAAREAERHRPLTFAQQLARVEQGAAISRRIPITRPAPDYTLGGVATGALR